MTSIAIRDQTEGDFAAVHALVIAAFKAMPYACGREQFLMDALWRTGAATVALVAEDAGGIIGQVAFSKVKVGGADVGWHGCGPLSVDPARHKQGLGGALMRAGLERLRALDSRGCVLVGDPAYYRRFGFANPDAMRFPGVPPEVFMALAFGGETPKRRRDVRQSVCGDGIAARYRRAPFPPRFARSPFPAPSAGKDETAASRAPVISASHAVRRTSSPAKRGRH